MVMDNMTTKMTDKPATDILDKNILDLEFSYYIKETKKYLTIRNNCIVFTFMYFIAANLYFYFSSIFLNVMDITPFILSIFVLLPYIIFNNLAINHMNVLAKSKVDVLELTKDYEKFTWCFSLVAFICQIALYFFTACWYVDLKKCGDYCNDDFSFVTFITLLMVFYYAPTEILYLFLSRKDNKLKFIRYLTLILAFLFIVYYEYVLWGKVCE